MIRLGKERRLNEIELSDVIVLDRHRINLGDVMIVIVLDRH